MESEELLKHGGRKGYYLGHGERRALEGRRNHAGGVNLVLLLHDILASKLKGDGKTELSRLLEKKKEKEISIEVAVRKKDGCCLPWTGQSHQRRRERWAWQCASRGGS